MGRAGARGSLRTSPVSQRQCVGFRLTIESRDALGLGWQVVVEEDAFDSFILADRTGKAVLHPPFEIRLAPYRESFFSTPSPALASLLASKGLAAVDVFAAGREFRYAEIVLAPGQAIIAAGNATLEIDPGGRAPSYRDPPVMCHLKAGEKPVILADLADRVSR